MAPFEPDIMDPAARFGNLDLQHTSPAFRAAPERIYTR
jgi:hypothetical protein